MQPSAVVEADDVVSNIVGGFCMIGVVLLPNSLHLQIQEEALHHRVVPAVAFTAHAVHQAMPSKQRLMFSAGVLGGFNRLSQHLNYGGVEWEIKELDTTADRASSLLTNRRVRNLVIVRKVVKH